ncbi:hypothetical protein [Bradyrhizobium sp. USDA 3364]
MDAKSGIRATEPIACERQRNRCRKKELRFGHIARKADLNRRIGAPNWVCEEQYAYATRERTIKTTTAFRIATRHGGSFEADRAALALRALQLLLRRSAAFSKIAVTTQLIGRRFARGADGRCRIPKMPIEKTERLHTSSPRVSFADTVFMRHDERGSSAEAINPAVNNFNRNHHTSLSSNTPRTFRAKGKVRTDPRSLKASLHLQSLNAPRASRAVLQSSSSALANGDLATLGQIEHRVRNGSGHLAGSSRIRMSVDNRCPVQGFDQIDVILTRR